MVMDCLTLSYQGIALTFSLENLVLLNRGYLFFFQTLSLQFTLHLRWLAFPPPFFSSVFREHRQAVRIDPKYQRALC